MPGTRGEPDNSHGKFPRILLGATATLQTLCAYPVAGSHRYWATFLLIPVALVVIGDGVRILRQENPELQRLFLLIIRSPRRDIPRLAGVVAAITAFVFFVRLPERMDQYGKNVSLGLHGAERIRLNGERVALYNLLA